MIELHGGFDIRIEVGFNRIFNGYCLGGMLPCLICISSTLFINYNKCTMTEFSSICSAGGGWSSSQLLMNFHLAPHQHVWCQKTAKEHPARQRHRT